MYTNENPPTEDEYIRIIAKLRDKFSDAQIITFKTQYNNSGRAITSQQLRDTLGYSRIGASNLRYGLLGKLLAQELNFDVSNRPSKSRGWWRVLATGDGSKKHFTWVMRPELAIALEKAGIVDRRDSGLINAPDLDYSIAIVETAIEGRRQLKVHIQRERNSGLVKSKKASAESWDCEICGFNSEATYGIPYCEAHHLIPLASIENTSETKLDDLALLCSNCHRIIHSSFPPLTLDAVRSMIQE